MSDRIKGFMVVLGHDYKDEDAYIIKSAIEMIKGVIKVDCKTTNAEDYFERERIKYEYRDKIINIFN